MKMLIGRDGDVERLLYQTVSLASIAILHLVGQLEVRAAAARAVGRLAGPLRATATGAEKAAPPPPRLPSISQ